MPLKCTRFGHKPGFNEDQFKFFEQDNQDSLRLQDKYFLEHSDLTEIIFDSCFNVMNDFGVGFYIVEIVVNESVIIEAKCCKELAHQYSAQLINYLKASGIKVGLLINFGTRNIQYKRLCHPDYYRAAVGDPAHLDQ